MPSSLKLVAAVVAWSTVAYGQDLASPGPYQVGQTTVTFNVPGDGNQNSLLYFPTIGGGLVDPSGGMYPGIVLSHGYLQDADRYHSTMVHLASHGYIVLGFDGQTDLFPDHQEYVDGVRTSLDYFQLINSQSGTFQGRINTNAFGLVGHSLGGGVSIVEAATDSRVKAIVGLAAADTFTSPTAKNAIGNVQAPIRLLVGTDDAIASLGNSSQPLYNNAQDPKQLLVLQGAGHGGYEDSTNFPDTGTMPRSEQLAITRREVTSFFDLYLKGDESVWRDVWGPDLPPSPNISSVQLDPGMTLTSFSGTSLQGTPGQTTTYTVSLTNTSRWASTFDLFADDSTWSTTINTPTTAVLQPGQSTTFQISVTPTAGDFNAQDQILVSARSGRDGHTRQYTFLTTTTGEGTELATASLENRSLITLDTADNQSTLQGPAAGLVTPIDIKYDAAGNYYVADPIMNRVTKYDVNGQATIVATPTDGILFPTGIALDDTGNLYVSSYLNQRVVKIGSDGTSWILADESSGLDNPFGLTIDSAGNVYVASVEGRNVIKIDSQGNTSIFADESDGLLTPIDVKVDALGNVYVADVLRGMIFSFTPDGNGSVFADRDDGLFTPSGMMFDHAGNLFVSNYLNDTIVKLTPGGIGTIIADAADGIDSPFGLSETTAGLGNLALGIQAVPELGSAPLLFAALVIVAVRVGRKSSLRRSGGDSQ